MPPRTNPAAGKQPANGQWKSYTRNGKKVRGHTRSVNARRMAATWAGTATSGVVCVGIIAEAGFTAASAIGVTLIALFTWGAVVAGGYAEKNKAKMAAQKKRGQATKRKPTARRTTTRRTPPGTRRLCEPNRTRPDATGRRRLVLVNTVEPRTLRRAAALLESKGSLVLLTWAPKAAGLADLAGTHGNAPPSDEGGAFALFR